MTRLKTLTAILFIATIVIASSCKKDEEETAPATVTECFSDTYNGTYNGSGTINGTPQLSVTVTLTKLSCTSCKIDAGSVVDTIISLEESSGGGYNGKDTEGDGASVKLDGSSLQVNTSKIIFNGSK